MQSTTGRQLYCGTCAQARRKMQGPAMRKACLELFGGLCVSCGAVAGVRFLAIHHIYGRGSTYYPDGPLRNAKAASLVSALLKYYKETGCPHPGFELRCQACHHRWLLAPHPPYAKPEMLDAEIAALESRLREARKQKRLLLVG
jgi:hypothetical protein